MSNETLIAEPSSVGKARNRLSDTLAKGVETIQPFFDAETASGQLPGIKLDALEGLYPLYRDWVVNLGDVLGRLPSERNAIGALRVYADTIVIPENLDVSLIAYSLLLVARSIVIGSGAKLQLDLTGNSHAQILLCARHFRGELSLGCRWSGLTTESAPRIIEQDYKVNSTSTIPGGIRLWHPDPDNEPELEILKAVPPDLTAQTRPIYRLLLGEYQAGAIALSRDNLDDSIDFADWVRFCAASNPQLVSLGIDATTLAAQARSMQSDAPYAPRLSLRVYQSLSRSYVDTLCAYEDKIRSLELAEDIKSGFSDIAQSVLSDARRSAENDERLIDQTLKFFGQAERSVLEMEQRLRKRLREIELLKIDLEAEAKKHVYDEILSAGFTISVQLVTSTISIAAAIGGAVATGGATAPVAVLAVGGKLVEAGAIIVKAGAEATTITFSEKEVKDSSDVSGMTKKLGAAAKSLAELCKMVIAIYKIIKTVTDADQQANEIRKTLGEADFGEAGVAELTRAYYWDLMTISARSSLKVPLAMGLSSAEQLVDQIESLAIEGRALAAQRSTLLELGQELTRLVWRHEMSGSQLKEAQARLDRTESETREDFMDWVRLEAVSIKRGVFTALYDYTRAYRYWALKSSLIKPSMIEDGAGYRAILTKMEKEIVDSLTRGFEPVPQAFSDKEILITCPQRLSALTRGEPVVIPLRRDELIFRDYGRVRIERVRAWLDGVEDSAEPLLLELRAGGSFYDRLGDETFLFTGSRFLVTFQYVPGKGEKGIVTDGIASRRERDLYFLPTPFTDWTIELKHVDDETTDLSGLTALRLSFSGSHIYSPGCGCN